MSEKGIEDIKKKMFRHPNAKNFSMERVPVDTIEVFKQFANDEYVGDYGMAFKKLVDSVLVDPPPFTELFGAIENHEQRLLRLEGKCVPAGDTKKYRIRKTLGGKEIKIPIRETIRAERKTE